LETLKIQTLHAAAQTENIASNKILQKIGMTKTEIYLEENIPWNWYQITFKNFLSITK
jgi:[ribosomal protein S5]-alanine N-acetyltransferase